MEKVITVSGQAIDRLQSKKIGGLYYKIGDVNVFESGDCYLITNPKTSKEVYYRANNPNIIWDYDINKYVYRTNQVEGIVGFDNRRSTWRKGYFTRNPLNNIYLNDGSIILSKEALERDGVYYNSNNGGYTTEKPTIPQRVLIGSKRKYQTYGNNFYNFSEISSEGLQDFRNLYINSCKDTESPFDKFFEGLTIGAEVETSGGNIPENWLYRLGLVPLKDGSIEGHEYVTTIIDRNYLFLLENIFKQCSQNCIVTQNCSLHYHIGNIVPKTKEFVVAFWILYYRLQDTLEEIIPPYKRDLGYLSNKRVSSGGSTGAKDHCKRIPLLCDLDSINVNDVYNNILLFLNDNKLPENSSNLLYKHNRSGSNKWDIDARYYSVNLIPFLFEKKQTIEFRLHSGTVNFHKAFAWLCICVALIKYAQLQMEKIINAKEKIMLIDVVKVFNDGTQEGIFLVDWLIEYIRSRRKNFINLTLTHDIYGREFSGDNKFVFDYKGLNPLTFKK